MAVMHTTAYGVLLTQDFGDSLDKQFDPLIDLINNKKYEEDDYDYGSKWLATCPSAERDQMVLGFEVRFDKNLEMEQVEKKWQELIKTVPEEWKELIKDFPEPNFHVMSGKY